MSAIISKLPRFPALSLLPARRGWIGVDVGTRAIKLAQVERTAAGLRLAGRMIISEESQPPLKPSAFQDGTFTRIAAQFAPLRSMFRGSTAAVSLPTSVVEMRSLELPVSSQEELLAMVQEELSAENADSGERAFDVWTCGDATQSDEVSRLTVVSLEQETAARVAADMLKSGLRCQVLDAAPCALARAVSMGDPQSALRPAAALDLGFSSALVTVVVNGRPAFCRSFRGCGLQALMQPLQDKLGISAEECRHLLKEFGVGGTKLTGSSPAAQATSKLIAAPLDNLVGELQRTWSFLQQQFRSLVPETVWLFGGGAGIGNLASHLSDRTGVPTQVWRLGGHRSPVSSGDEAMFGVAAALSALAWEAGSCT